MSAQPISTFKTNTQEGSVHEVVLDCDTLWAMGQEEAIRLLSNRRSSTSSKYEWVTDFSTRAARIAAAYASFYLEQGEDGKPELKGRFYWMGLAAFASKQVKCGLDFIPDDPYLFLTPLFVQPQLRIAKTALGKGNFWLFQDIFVWHWFYRKYPEQFEECAPERDVRNCKGQIRQNIDSLPWVDEAVYVLNNLSVTEEVKSGFRSIKETEALISGSARGESQLSSLMKIAGHEQRKILQPLIYEEPLFQSTLDMQAGFEWMPFVPVRVAAFSASCDVEDPGFRIQMESGDLYNVSDRMEFINRVARQYHLLMQKKETYMEGEMHAIAAWAGVQ